MCSHENRELQLAAPRFRNIAIMTMDAASMIQAQPWVDLRRSPDKDVLPNQGHEVSVNDERTRRAERDAAAAIGQSRAKAHPKRRIRREGSQTSGRTPCKGGREARDGAGARIPAAR